MPSSSKPIAVLAGLALLAAGCGEGPQEPGPTTIELPVRAWVLSSSITTLDGSATDQEVRGIMRENNRIWAQAGIRWAVEPIRRDSVTREGEELLHRARQSGDTLPSDFVERLLPLDDLHADGWNVYLVHNLTFLGAQGAYIPSIPAVLSSEVAPFTLAPIHPGVILAHEFGHSLGLDHVPCGEEGNLMALPFCDVGTTRLSEDQIRRARRQAERGVPVTSLDSIVAIRDVLRRR